LCAIVALTASLENARAVEYVFADDAGIIDVKRDFGIR